MIGILLQMQNKPAEAEQRYERALQVEPRAGVAANNLGWMIAERGGNLDIALQHAQTAVVALPDNADAQDTLGWIYYKKGLTELAIKALLQATQKAPGRAEFHYRLGLAYAKAGQRTEARRALEHALKLQPTFEGSADARAVLARL
jgi:tetratricopeptide (TPR) repeat protein